MFKKQLKEQKWKPEYGHAYYSFDAFYNVVKKDWMNDLFDQARMNMNIVFATEQIAEFEREKRMVKENLVFDDHILEEYYGKRERE